jgi:GT2 family glycosyltransferase
MTLPSSSDMPPLVPADDPVGTAPLDAGTEVDVSVIVIAHDVRDEVLNCLASVYRHKGASTVECILVDNASRDGTARAVAEQYPEVRLIRRPTNECLPGRNHGLRAARGRYRMFLDSDAELTPGALDTLVAVLKESPRVGLVGPRLVYADGRLQLSTRRFPPALLPVLRRPPLNRLFDHRPTIRRHLMADDPHDRRRRVEYVIGACMLFSREAQAAVGEIDPHIWFGHDDADWCFRIRDAGYDVAYAPDAEVIHDYRRTSASRPLSLLALRFLVAHVYFQRKWWSERRRLRAEGAEMDRDASDSTSLR